MPSDKRARQRERTLARREAILAAQQRAARNRRIVRTIIPVLVVVALLVVYNLSRSDNKQDTDVKTTATTAGPVKGGQAITGDTTCPPPEGAKQRAAKFEKTPPMCIDPAKKYTARFETSEGKITVALDTGTTPGTTNNFVVLSRYKYYDGSIIHRTDPSIDIIQGGSPSTQSASDPGPGYTIKDEGDPASRKYDAGDLVMARSQGADSGGAQFFFVVGPKASGLNGGQGPTGGTYVSFGKVTDGLPVVKKILGLHKADAANPLGGAPRRQVVVKRIVITEQ